MVTLTRTPPVNASAVLKALDPTTAMKVAQGLVSAFGSTRLVQDGAIGPRTLSAYAKLDPVKRQSIDVVNKEMGIVFPDMIPIRDVSKLIREVEVDAPASYLNMVVDLESYKANEFYVLDREGKFVGLTQFSSSTYEFVRTSGNTTRSGKDISFILPEFNVFLTLGPVMMAKASLEAAAAYYQMNIREVKRRLPRDVKWTDELAYLAHGQGPAGAASYLLTGKLLAPKQSAKALAVFKRALGQYRSA